MEISRKVGRIYAAAIFELAREADAVGRVGGELLELDRLYKQDVAFRRFFTSPRVERPKKLAGLKQLFEGKLHNLTFNLLAVLVEKGREAALDNVVDAFERYRDEAEDRVHVHVRSAVELSDAQREAIKTRLAGHAASIVMHEKVDDSLIGGILIRIHDFEVDTTLRTRLRELKQQLLPYTSEF